MTAFKGLCLDRAHEDDVIGRFGVEVTGCRFEWAQQVCVFPPG